MPSKILLARVLSALRSAMDRFSFSFFGKTAIRKTGNLSLRQIYTTRAPPLFPIPLRATRTFRNPPVPRRSVRTIVALVAADPECGVLIAPLDTMSQAKCAPL